MLLLGTEPRKELGHRKPRLELDAGIHGHGESPPDWMPAQNTPTGHHQVRLADDHC